MNDDVLDLEICAREPIHIPGAIQPYGVMFVLSLPELNVLQVSENVEAMLGITAAAALEQGLPGFLAPEQIEAIRFALNSSDPEDSNPVRLGLHSLVNHVELDGALHQHDGFGVFELEPTTVAGTNYFMDFYRAVTKTTTQLQSASTPQALVEIAATGLRQITGFDRVMVYRFAESNDGEVIAESKIDALEPLLGLWYPASDIPEQARRMYTLSPIRSIPQATYVPVPLIPTINPQSGRPTDLSFSNLRSVSQVHCEYLRNMGVTASMSVSIVIDGRLWGLISCHHGGPNYVPFETRKACTFLAQVLSGEIARRQSEMESQYQSLANEIQAKFMERMVGASDPLGGLVNSEPNLLHLIPASGAAVVSGTRIQTLGATPSDPEMMALVEAMQKAGLPATFATKTLKNYVSVAEGLTLTASGLIALELSQNPSQYVMWFRPEIAQTVTWGGNPDKPAQIAEDGFRISPRKSFAAWQEIVRGTAAPWTRAELRVAYDLRSLIQTVLYKKSSLGDVAATTVAV